MPSDYVLSLSPELSVLQDPLNLVLFVFINYNWWSVGLHYIILIGIEWSHVKDIMDSSQRLPVASSSEVHVVGSLPYPVCPMVKGPTYLSWSFLGALQSQVSSA